VREIHHPQDAEYHREADGEQRVHAPEAKTVDDLLNEEQHSCPARFSQTSALPLNR
jgi:hypothetical protein